MEAPRKPKGRAPPPKRRNPARTDRQDTTAHGSSDVSPDGDGAERVMREHVRRSRQALVADMDERRQQS
ncbi:hypothetical protein ACWD25_59615 [Streptomyces sp. NPDC002920]